MLQYIGARYVPIFYQNSLDPTSSEWEVNVTYEPLTWVSLPNGYMYISKKEVPANVGTPASNPDYWLEAGQYNAYIQSLQDQIDDMNDGTVAGSLQNQINEMNDGSVSGSLQNQINDMQDGNIPGSLQTQINETSNDLTFLNESLYGESGAGDTMFISDSFGPNVRDILQNEYGFTITYDGTQAGAGFKNDIYINKMNTLAASMTADDKNNLKYLIVTGGTNDSDVDVIDTILSKVYFFCQRARELFPNARILIGFIATLYAASTDNKRTYKAMCKNNYIDGMLKANVGAEFIDNLTEAVADCFEKLDPDRIHPTNTWGARAQARIIMSAVRKQNITIPCYVRTHYKTITNTSNGVTFNTTIYFYNTGKGFAKMIIIPQTLAAGATLSDGVNYVLIPYDDLPLSPFPAKHGQYVKFETGDAWTQLDINGLILYGGFGTSIAGSNVTLTTRADIEFDMPIYN